VSFLFDLEAGGSSLVVLFSGFPPPGVRFARVLGLLLVYDFRGFILARR